jgi:hypothetical protein
MAKSVNDAGWAIFIFPPYTPVSAIEAAIKMKASPAIQSAGLSERDDINLLVFMNAENIQIVVAVPRQVIDFSVDKAVQPLTRAVRCLKKGASASRWSWPAVDGLSPGGYLPTVNGIIPLKRLSR